MTQSIFTPGKIILSGEYAVLFGFPGIAIPSSLGLTITFEETDQLTLRIKLKDEMEHPLWREYAEKILSEIQKKKAVPNGLMRISSTLPLGKGMGSSSALVIGMAKASGMTEKAQVKAIEDVMTPGNSGIDFEVIWSGKPVFFEGKDMKNIELNLDFLDDAILIDTGTPDQTTAELVSWVKERREELDEPLHEIMHCSQDLLAGKNPSEIFPRHHRAQVQLGVVPNQVQKLIAGIEKIGGAAKVIGAGSRTGGGGMVLALHKDRSALSRLAALDYPVFSL